MNFLVAGLIAGVAVTLVNVLFHFVTQSLYPAFQLEMHTCKAIRPLEDPRMMYAGLVHPILESVLFSFIFSHFKLAAGTDVFSAVALAAQIWFVCTLPGMFLTYSSFRVSLPLVIMWSVSTLVQAATAAAAVAWCLS